MANIRYIVRVQTGIVRRWLVFGTKRDICSRSYGKQSFITDVVNTYAVGDNTTVNIAQRCALHIAVSCATIN
jgi:hypothetical protein